MKVLLQLTAALALLLVAVSAAVFCWDSHILAAQATQTLKDFDEAIKVQSANLAEDEMHIDSVLHTVDAAAGEQRAYWQKTSADSDKTVKALRITIDRAGLLLKHADESQQLLTADADRQLSLTSDSAQRALSSLDHVADALAFQVNDIDLGPTFANLDESSVRLANTMGNLQDASAHANRILLDGEHTADYYEKKLTTPASFAHKLAIGALDVGSKMGNIMAGFVK